MLIFPNLDAGNSAYKLLNRLGGAKAVGPFLMDISKPFNVLQRDTDMENVVNVIAFTVTQSRLWDICIPNSCVLMLWSSLFPF